MSEVVLTRGLPASGKSTFATEWVDEDPTKRARVNRDDLRMATFGTYETFKIAGAEDTISRIERASVLALLEAGYDVVVDACHLRVKYVRDWRRFALGHGHTIRWVDFPISVDGAVARDTIRGKRGDRAVGNNVILRMSRYLKNGELPVVPDEEEPVTPIQVEYDPNLFDAVIFDIDGTLALMGDRNPHDLSKVKFDQPNPAIIEALRLERAAGNNIIFLSGREGTHQCWADTVEWLREHASRIPGEHLLMRAAGDGRRDSIIKTELFNTYLRGKYNIVRVYDDRNQVVKAWRDLGLTCLQVAEGAF
jgi:predicted kinase